MVLPSRQHRAMCSLVSCEAIRHKPNKPLALDARCLLRAINAAAVWKSLKQAWIFSGGPIITHSGLCINRKAINIDKPLVLWRTASRQRYSGVSYIRGRCPRYLKVVPSRHQSACGSYFYHGLNGVMSYGGKKRSKSLLLSLGLRPCSPMRMLSHESKLPCPTIHIRLVCPLADGKATKQIAALGSTK